MIFNNYSGFGRLGALDGAWEDWCDQKFANDPVNLAKCKGWAPFAPWTDVGAALRGIPKPGSLIDQIIGTTPEVGQPGQPPASSGIGASTTTLLIGAGILGVGLLVLFSSPKSRG